MNQKEKRKLKEMLNNAGDKYLRFVSEDIDFNLPCVRREAIVRQGHAFNLAEMLYSYGFISWEDCCQVWTKIGFTKDEIDCDNLTCTANSKGKCSLREKGEITNENQISS